jgi:hypothetical protein
MSNCNRVVIYVDQDEPIVSDMAEFLANNETLGMQDILTLLGGGVVHLGGGAAPDVRVYGERVSS